MVWRQTSSICSTFQLCQYSFHYSGIILHIVWSPVTANGTRKHFLWYTFGWNLQKNLKNRVVNYAIWCWTMKKLHTNNTEKIISIIIAEIGRTRRTSYKEKSFVSIHQKRESTDVLVFYTQLEDMPSSKEAFDVLHNKCFSCFKV